MNDPEYIFEFKHDGFRALAYIQNGECKFVSHNQNDLRFSSLKRVLGKLPVNDAIIDGEIICVDSQGVSRFNELFNRKAAPILYAFDLLWLNGEDLRERQLIVRKARLSLLLRRWDCPRILYAQHVEGFGTKVFAEVCGKDLEGMVGKRKLSLYKDGGTGWIKIKNPKYSQAEGRHEMMARAK